MQKLIERLTHAREEKNITLKDISYKTNIRLEVLTRIESGDTTFQPEPYIKAILKKYAETIGVKLHQSDFEEPIQTPTSQITKEEQPIHETAQPKLITSTLHPLRTDFEIPQP